MLSINAMPGHHQTRRAILSFLSAGAVAPLLPHSLCAQTRKLTVGYVPASEFLPLYIADKKGYFKSRGVDLTLTKIQIVSNIPAAVLSGSVDVGMTTAPGFIQAVQGGLNLVVISGGSRMRADNPVAALLARADANIKAPGDLVGKRIGIPGFRSLLDVLFQNWLLQNGVDVSKVQLIEAPHPQFGDLLRAKTIDASVTIEPFRSRIVEQGAGAIVSNFVGQVDPDIAAAFWMASRRWTGENPELVKAFREAYAEGIRYAAERPDDIKSIERDYVGVNSPVTANYTATISASDLDRYAALMKNINLLPRPFDAGASILP